MPKSLKTRLFDYGLSEAQEKRARRLHEESIVIDMVPMGPIGPEAYTPEMVKQIKDDWETFHNLGKNQRLAMALPYQMAARGEFQTYKEWWDASGVTACSRSVTADSIQSTFEALGVTTLQFDTLDWLIKARTADDIRRAKAEGKHTGFINSQNTLAVGQSLDNLDILHDFGLNMLQLTYNNMNFVGAGCTERTDAGVSNFGVKFIERMDRLGIIVDTGHCGRQTTLDACKISKNPVIVSHSSAQGVYYHARGKSDEELEAVAGTGGVIGVVAVPFFLSGAAEVTMEHFLDHVDYIVKLVGHKHVGIGTDWPMNMPDWSVQMFLDASLRFGGFRPEDRLSSATVKGFKDYRDFINITRGLVSRGYSDAKIKDILGGNWLTVMEAVWK